jgi:mRNA deadenylase 3'-5' endonuclease subunit Ccr4
MASSYDLSKLSQHERMLVETGQRSMCDYCEHSVFVDSFNKQNELEPYTFIKCLLVDITFKPPRCSVFECHMKVEEDG